MEISLPLVQQMSDVGNVCMFLEYLRCTVRVHFTNDNVTSRPPHSYFMHQDVHRQIDLTQR